MKVRFLSIAEVELDEAIAYYETMETGLGLRFFSEVKNSIERISNYPEAWHTLSPSTRRCRMKVFPYGIIYQARNEEILVVAVASLNRAPEYWKSHLG